MSSNACVQGTFAKYICTTLKSEWGVADCKQICTIIDNNKSNIRIDLNSALILLLIVANNFLIYTHKRLSGRIELTTIFYFITHEKVKSV